MTRARQLLPPSASSALTVVCGDFNEPNIAPILSALKPLELHHISTAKPTSPATPNAAPELAPTSMFGAIDHWFVSDAARLSAPMTITPAPEGGGVGSAVICSSESAASER